VLLLPPWLTWLPAVLGFYGDAPFPQQPFRDVGPIPVSLAPDEQLTRGGVDLLRESQFPDLHFKLGDKNGSWREGTAPVWISAFAGRNLEIDWVCHKPTWYSSQELSVGAIRLNTHLPRVKTVFPVLLCDISLKLTSGAYGSQLEAKLIGRGCQASDALLAILVGTPGAPLLTSGPFRPKP
jgi:hypothetical protein